MSRGWYALAGRLVVPLGLLVCDLIVLVMPASGLRLLAGLALLFVLPGLAWLQSLRWLHTREGVERLVLTGGLSGAMSALALLGAVYWPGPWSLPVTLIALNLVSLAGFGVGLATGSISESEPWQWPARHVSAVLLVIVCAAVFLRWYAIGYGEFHEDELENMRQAVGAMGGDEAAPFLDSKGPLHWLLPGGLWLMLGWVNEAAARAPFAIASSLSVLAVYALGRRMAGPGAGLLGAGFATMNGFFVAYARFVENPALIVLWGILAAWCAYRYYHENLPALPVLGGLLLAAGLVAHPDVLLYLPPFGFMLALAAWRNRGARGWRPFAVAATLFLAITLAFYVPFVRDPNFQRTQEYFAAERIGTQWLYNRVANMFEQDALYSTRYYGPLLVIFSGVILIQELRRFGRAGSGLFVLFAGAAASTVYVPSAWDLGGLSAAFLPFAAMFALLAWSPRTSFEVKSLVLWFAVPFLALEFLAKDAADHIQVAYPAWSLLAAMGLVQLWGRLASGSGRLMKAALVVVLAGAAGLVLYYEYLQFLGPVTGYWRAEADARYNPSSTYRLVYGGLPRPRKLFANPRLGGWKVVGYLYDTGQLQGDFRSINESFAAPIWYTHQTPRSCFNDPQNYFVRIDARGAPEEMAQLPAAGYGLTRIVRVDGQPKLYLFEKGVPAAEEPAVYDVGDYRAAYDRSATPERYLTGPAPGSPLHATFGGQLLLRGYDLSATRLKPGETLAVSLHWQALAPMSTHYRAFVHVETDRMWGQHDDDPVCRLRTDEWRPPQAGVGQFRVALDPATPPGVYPVTVGVYNPETWERLEILDERGQSLGQVLELATITVE